MNKEAVLMELWEEVAAALEEKGKLVFGEGSVNARLAIVGEAPGREEERWERPFVGRAGRLLNQLLKDVGLKRDELWITNVVKWRPTQANDATRAPTVREMAQGGEWLRRELAIIGCPLVLGLGNIAGRTLVSKDFKMNEQHGQWYQGIWGHEVLVTFHPAYALRAAAAGDGEMVIGWMREDMERVRDRYIALKANSGCAATASVRR